jgi:O-antigen/teichoic acid export membrane protein
VKRHDAAIAFRAVGLAANALLFAIMSRRLPPEIFGRWIGIAAAFQVLVAIAEFGTPIGQQLAAGNGGRRAVSNGAAIIHSIGSAVLVSSVALVALTVFGFERIMVIAMVPWLVLTRLTGPLQADLAFVGRSVFVTAADAGSRLVTAAVLLVVPADPRWASLALAVAPAIVLAITLRPVPIERPSGEDLRRLVAKSWAPAGGQVIAAVHGRNDQVIIASSRHRLDLPSYAAAYRLFDAVVTVAGAASLGVIGELDRHGDVRQFVRGQLRRGAFIGVIAGLAMAITGPFVVAGLLGSFSLVGTVSAWILAVAAVPAVVNCFAARMAFGLHLGRRLTCAQIPTLCGNLAANALLIQRYGVLAAASTTLVFEVVGLIASLAVLRSGLVARIIGAQGRAEVSRSAPVEPWMHAGSS